MDGTLLKMLMSVPFLRFGEIFIIINIIIIACLHYPYIRVYRLYDMSVGSKQTFA